MSAALCLMLALGGGHGCPPGTVMHGAHYYAAPHVAHFDYAPYRYRLHPHPAAPGTTTYGPATAYGAAATDAYAPPQMPAYDRRAPAMQPQPQYRAARPEAERRNVVNMTDRARFEPALITVEAGETVEWRNTSRQPHTVTADPELANNPALVVLPEGAEPIHSGEIPPGSGYSYTFRTPGIYYYVCLPHEEMGMVGIVVVLPRRNDAQARPGSTQESRGRFAPDVRR